MQNHAIKAFVLLFFVCGVASSKEEDNFPATKSVVGTRIQRLAALLSSQADRSDTIAENTEKFPSKVRKLSSYSQSEGDLISQVGSIVNISEFKGRVNIAAQGISGWLGVNSEGMRDYASKLDTIRQLVADSRNYQELQSVLAGEHIPIEAAKYLAGGDVETEQKLTSLEVLMVGWGVTSTVDYPAVGMLLNTSGGVSEPVCTGTLVAPTIVLTAAHCFCSPNDGFGSVKACNDQMNAIKQHSENAQYQFFFQHIGIRPISNVIVHNDYRAEGKTVTGDLALAILEEPIKDVQPAEWNNIEPVAKNARGFTVGFGRQNTAEDLAEIAQGVGTKAIGKISLSSCDTLRNNGFHSDGKLCWPYKPLDQISSICSGDSGGPLFISVHGRWVVAGVTSFEAGNRRGDECKPGPNVIAADTDVFSYRPWIEEQLAKTLTSIQPNHETMGNSLEGLPPLDPINNGQERFLYGYLSPLNHFDKMKRFIDKVRIDEDTSRLRFTINVKTSQGPNPIGFKLWSPDGKEQFKQGEAVLSLDLTGPLLKGEWRFQVEGPRSNEMFQMVATPFGH